ncbi:flavin reductase family protein [Erysipelothrix rhusiopathiae]|uniref:flavin reductase family protein n=1 Tax=Erysipelothrix rhusiopathiae TaxID=1648 RepID=UPI000F431235|nr:flavin reductase family protein [Erysipelothrix rhusiopathiae]AYV35312.1 flavin reductase family protein [Erysipelothrix rhusiopathiae]MDE8082257.1 flavin reductase family protein [Erysipelothrix rhusiopathiae]MDE8333197.1 flavin reductase family protein [Erysipelothrix rhusiopathiae]
MKFNTHELSAKDRYKLLTGSVVPRPIAWITTRNTDDSINLAPFSFFSLVSTEVPIVSVAINRSNGKLKDTSKNLLQTRECVIHIANHEHVEAMNESSMTLSYGESEVSKVNLETQSSTMIDTLSLKDVKIKLETVLFSHQEIENEDGVCTDLFLLKVLHLDIDDSIFMQENQYIDVNKFGPIARLAGNQFAEIKPVFTLKRPK